MILGYDAKRAFRNQTGLGNYSRQLIDMMGEAFNKEELYLFTPSGHALAEWKPPSNSKIIHPRFNHPAWRSFELTSLLKKYKVDLYHGLSHELPFNIERLQIPKVVSMHDCIFKYFPDSYNWLDRKIYDLKWRNAILKADKILAISRSTADDLIKFYDADPGKIEVTALFADPVFHTNHSSGEIANTLGKYSIQKPYFLFVGDHHPRKNLDLLISAYHSSNRELPPTVVLTSDSRKLGAKLKEKSVAEHFYIPTEYIPKSELAHIYVGALALVYPSLYEGFGLPLLEAMNSGTAVITCQNSSLKEVGGEAVLYTSEQSEEELILHMHTIAWDEAARKQLEQKGIKQARKFSRSRHQQQLEAIYNSLIG